MTIHCGAKKYILIAHGGVHRSRVFFKPLEIIQSYECIKCQKGSMICNENFIDSVTG